jgi:cellulose synthase/poly-beta-1,6-N-acetylglucosamine synthase-like glycosyltransferase
VTFLLLFEIYRGLLRVLLSIMGLHFILGTIGFLRRKGDRGASPAPPEVWPLVTVQLPLRNEYYAARRVLESAAALDYPSDRVQIQALDDSDDETVGVVAETVQRLQDAGVDVVHLRRFYPIGYKAGALSDGMLYARGELVAIFDADFVIPSDFLKRTVPHFADPKVGMVQGRWAHDNRNESLFTRLQAQILDGLMVVEQTAKSLAGLPLQFNGTAGVWRAKAIHDAGGWTFDSLTEDLDLSLRAQLAGYRLVHLPEVAAPCELPTTLGLFRVQQRRWALGTAQLLRKRLFHVLRASIPFGARVSTLFQLGRHFGHPLLLIMVATVPLTTFGIVQTIVHYHFVNIAVFALLVAGVAFQHAVAAREIGRSAVRAILFSPLVIVLALGLAPTYTVALAYGLRDRAGPFHRTPKVIREPRPGEPDYRARRSALILVELAVGGLYVWFTALAWTRGQWLDGAFLAFVALSFTAMGLGSLRVDATRAPAHPDPDEGTRLRSAK